MKRAAVLIGVDRTGGLQPLQAAAAGARDMAKWAGAQKMHPVEVLTDAGGGRVAVGDIKQAITSIIDQGTIEQLLVYFAGHGVYQNYSEYWLLSDAPRDTNAAVNMRASVELARRCGIPHVVIISDACRTAPQTVRAQNINGSEIFPNDDAGAEFPVDQFWACGRGDPAVEYQRIDSTDGYTALFTAALLDALEGRRAELLDAAADGRYVRPKPLRDYLQEELAARIEKLALTTTVIQKPDAHVLSADTAWVARLAPRKPRKPSKRAKAKPSAKPRPQKRPGSPPSASALVQELLEPALAGDQGRLVAMIDEADAAGVPGAATAARALTVTAVPFGPAHHETQCGFKIQGSTITAVTCPDARPEPFEGREVVRMWDVPEPGALALLRLAGGVGVVLPAIPGFLVSLTVDDDELVDVAYEPSDNSSRWFAFAQRAEQVRALRAVASASTRNGVFQLEGENALAFARAMQQEKGVDPTLGLYAAYAYTDLTRRDLIDAMAGYMEADLGAPLYDVAMLAGRLGGPTLGFAPLLSQGWPLRRALRATLPPALEGIEAHLVPSPWTLFDPSGTRWIHAAMVQGAV